MAMPAPQPPPPGDPPPPHPVRQPATEAEAKALASAVRLRIIRLCLDEPLTNQEIAARLDSHPATVLHHVRKLVATGFLVPQPARRGRHGAQEIPYLGTRRSWALDTDVHPDTDQMGAMVDAFRQELALVADPRGIYTSRLGLRLTPAEYEELTRRFGALLEEYGARPASPDGRAYSLFLAIHPDVGRDRPPSTSS